MFGSVRRAAVALTVGGVLMVVAPASASAAVTISLPAQAELTAGVLVTVPVTVTCGPYEFPPERSGLQLTIRQASKKAIARGSASTGGFDNFLTCDGAPHVYAMNVLADPTGPPFRKSDAVVQASAFTVTGCCTSDNAFVTQVVRLR
jgi:hypothetical protein